MIIDGVDDPDELEADLGPAVVGAHPREGRAHLSLGEADPTEREGGLDAQLIRR